MQGSGIVYGQEIQLRHLYSKCLLTLNSQVLAKQNGCVEVIINFLFLLFLAR